MKETDYPDDVLLNRLVDTAREVEVEDAAAAEDATEVHDAVNETDHKPRNAAHLPLGEAFHERVVAALQAQPGGGAALPETSEATDSRGRATILPWPSKWRAAAGLAAAMAAVLLLIVGRPSLQPSPLPEYRLELLGGAQDTRSPNRPRDATTSAVRHFVPGNRLEIQLRPLSGDGGDRDGDGDGDVAALLIATRGDELVPWRGPIDVSPRGSIRVVGHIGQELDITPGTWNLRLAVGRPGTLPDAQTLGGQMPSNAAWELYQQKLTVTALGGDDPR